MKIANVNVSFPYVMYDVEVSHYASRKSTAIEWVILEAINATDKDESFKLAPFSEVFDAILSIKEADRLIKPVLFDLVGHGMIIVDGLSDERSLGELTMSQFALTDKGQKLRKDGILPGSTVEDVISLQYDVFGEKLGAKKEKGLSTEATGVKAAEIEEGSDVVFPAGQIKVHLEEARSDSSYSWLTKQTQIQDLNEVSSSIYWKNTSRPLQVSKGFVCTVGDIDDSRLVSKALESLGLTAIDDAPACCLEDPDNDVLWLDHPKHTVESMSKALRASEIAISKPSCMNELWNALKNGDSATKVILVASADDFKATLSENKLLINLKDDFLTPDSLLLSASVEIRQGTFNLRSGDGSTAVTLLYGVQDVDKRSVKLIEAVAEKYYSQTPLVLVPLILIGEQVRLENLVSARMAELPDFGAKSEYLAALNHASKAITGNDALAPEAVGVLLKSELEKTFEGCSYENMPHRLGVCLEACKDIPDKTMKQSVLTVAVESLPPTDQLGNIWRMWESLEKVAGDLECIRGSQALRGIYSDGIIKSMLSVFTSDNLYEMPAYTVVERSIIQLRRSSDKLSELLPGFDLDKPLTEEDGRLACLGNKTSLENVFSELASWRKHFEEIGAIGIDLSKAGEEVGCFANISTSVESLTEGIKPFYDCASMKYQNVYVIDTCALMNDPSVVALFEDGKSMLVVPMVVLDELDGNKSSQDEDKAYKAREAIRAIDNHRAFEWLNLRETSHPELLGSDCDKDRNDNKILSVAIKYIFKRPLLITDDANLRNLAESNSIETTGVGDFVQKVSAERKSKKANSKKGKGKKH